MKWLEGKKTYLGAAALAAGAIAAFWFGEINGAQLTMVLGLALAAAGLGDKLQRYLPFVVSALEELKQRERIQTQPLLGGRQVRSPEAGPKAGSSS